MDSAAVTGAYTLAAGLGGVVLGWLGNWVQGSAANHRAEAREIDRQFTSLWRAVDQMRDAISIANTEPTEDLAASVERLRAVVLPLMYEAGAASVQLSTHGDERLSEASAAVYESSRQLCLLAIEDPGGHTQRDQLMLQAQHMLRTARDLARTSRWRWIYRRRRGKTFAARLSRYYEQASPEAASGDG